MSDNKKEEEVDLIVIVEYIKQLLVSFFSFIGKILIGIYFIIKKNVLYLIGSLIIGFLLALLSIWIKPPNYTTKIDIKTYDGMTSTVYNTIDYINSLVTNKVAVKELIDNGFSEEDYNKIKGIKIVPIIDSKESKTLYKNYLMELDSSYSVLMTYEEFMKSVDESEYNKHTIIVKSSEEINYKSLFNNIIYFLNEQSRVKTIVESDNELRLKKLDLIEENIAKLDSAVLFLKKSEDRNSSDVSDFSSFLNAYVNQRTNMINKQERLLKEGVYISVINRYDTYGFRNNNSRIVKVTLYVSVFFFALAMLYKIDSYLRSKK